jgi:RNA polymerase sigma-70 factor (sigma-E family)
MMRAVAHAPEDFGDGGEAGESLVDLYRGHYHSLVRLAALLLHDTAAAEDVTQDAFAKVHLAWPGIREPAKALAYVRSAVLNGARSHARHLQVVDRNRPPPPADAPSAEAGALAGEDHREIVAALRALPVRQRECLALRYYLGLSEAEIAATLGISAGSVKTHTHRGLAALEKTLEATA